MCVVVRRRGAAERDGESARRRDPAGVHPAHGAGGPHRAARRAHHRVHAGLLVASAAARRTRARLRLRLRRRLRTAGIHSSILFSKNR